MPGSSHTPQRAAGDPEGYAWFFAAPLG